MAEKKDKPVLDEQTFGRLLEAAYVLQEHSRHLHKLELNLMRQQDELGAREPLVSVPPGGELHAAAAGTFPVAAPSLEPSPAELFPGEFVPTDTTPSAHARVESAPAEPTVRDDYTFTLGQIVETQHQIQARHLELENAMSLVAERVTEIARAGGAAIAFLEGKKVRYRGAAGRMTLPVGTEVPLEKALCVACLKTGHVIRCPDVNPEFLLDPEECRRRGIQAMIAVPVFHEAGIAGSLELYYGSTQVFTEQDVHTCQLMAGLITEALAREEELSTRKSLANERALMLEALEKLKPNLATLADASAAKGAASRSTAVRSAGSQSVPATPSSGPSVLCRRCGNQLAGEELFCGKCGAPRGREHGDKYEAPSMQSKVAALWHMQEAMQEQAKKGTAGSPADAGAGPAEPSALIDPALIDPALMDPTRPEKPLADSIEEEMPEFFAAPELRAGRMPELKMSELEQVPRVNVREPEDAIAKPDLIPPKETTPAEDDADKIDPEGEPQAETAMVKAPAANWSSAMTAREFLEQMAGPDRPGALARFWKARRGDIYLAVAIILVVVVLRWGIWSNHSVSATGAPATAATSHRKAAPEADLSLFDRMLISLGLAEAPPAPEYHGNPDTQVWVDLHTALYYCPGTDLYGKTPKGRFATQHEAQLDQFEPAYRKACD